MRAARIASLCLLAAGGCARSCEPAPKVDLASPAGVAKQATPARPSPCLGPDDRSASIEDVAVAFAPDDKVTVRLLRLVPRDEPSEPPEGATRVELLRGQQHLGCTLLSDVVSLSSICTGPAEAACLSRYTAESLTQSQRFWAPKAFAASRLLVFFGDALDSDTPSIEVIQVQGGRARSVFHAEAGRTDKPFVYSRFEDVDGDGRPELLGLEAGPELDSCQPYAPLAIFSLLGEGEAARYVRNDALMEKWALSHGKAWHGAEPDPELRECDDEDGEQADAKGAQE